MRRLLTLAVILGGCQQTPSPEPEPAPARSATQPAKAAAPAPTPAPAVAPPAVGEAPAILRDVVGPSTVVIGGVTGLDALTRMADALIAALPAEARKDAPPEVLDPKARAAKLGADLTTAAGWAKLGVDASAGVAFALDATLPEGPVIYARLTDRAALVAALKKLGAALEEGDEADGITEYTLDGKPLWVGQRGDTAIIVARPEAAEADARARLLALVEAPTALADDPIAKRVFRDLGVGARGWFYASTQRLFDFAASKGEAVPNADFFVKRFPGLGFAVGPTSGGLRLLTDPKAAAALARVFRPSAPAAHFARYFPATGAFVMRATVNLAEAFDGVADLIPPAEGGARGKVMIAKNAVPIGAGVQLAELAKAFTGHIAATGDPAQLAIQPSFLVLLDVADRAAADQVVATILKRLTETQKVPTAPVEVAGHAGTRVGQGRGEVVVLRHEDVVFVGTAGLIEAALKVAEPAAGAIAAAIDGDAFYGFVVDVQAMADALAQQNPGPEAAAMKDVFGVLFGGAGGQLASGFYRDDEGITSHTGQASAMVVGVLAAIAIPAFVKYTKRAKASEARITLSRMASSLTLKALEGGPTFKLLGAPRTPAKKACGARYPADPAAWAIPGWQQIDFAIQDGHYYQYEVTVDGDKFALRAIGDLDCDGDESVFEIAGTFVDGAPTLSPMQVMSELE